MARTSAALEGEADLTLAQVAGAIPCRTLDRQGSDDQGVMVVKGTKPRDLI